MAKDVDEAFYSAKSVSGRLVRRASNAASEQCHHGPGGHY
jgi:hypothetical protein